MKEFIEQQILNGVRGLLAGRRQSYNPVLLQQEVYILVEALSELNRQKRLIWQQPLAAAALEDF